MNTMLTKWLLLALVCHLTFSLDICFLYIITHHAIILGATRGKYAQREFTHASADREVCLQVLGMGCCKARQCLRTAMTLDAIINKRSDNLSLFSRATRISSGRARVKPRKIDMNASETSAPATTAAPKVRDKKLKPMLDFKKRRLHLWNTLLTIYHECGPDFSVKVDNTDVCLNAWALVNGYTPSTVHSFKRRILNGEKTSTITSVNPASKGDEMWDDVVNWLLDKARERSDMMPTVTGAVHLPYFTKGWAYLDYCSYRKGTGVGTNPGAFDEGTTVVKARVPTYRYFLKIWQKDERIQKQHITTARRVGTLARCGRCDEFERRLKQVAANDDRGRLQVEAEFKGHQLLQAYERQHYRHKQFLAREYPDEFLSCIIDGTTNRGYTVPNTSGGRIIKGYDAENCLPQSMTGVVFHGIQEAFFFPSNLFTHNKNANWVIQCLMESLTRLSQHPHYTDKGLPRTLFVQLDNCSGENKNKYMFAFFSELVRVGVFDCVNVSFLPVGHTHEDIDQLFSVLNRFLRAEHLTLTLSAFDELIVEAAKLRDLHATAVRMRATGDFKAALLPFIDTKFSGYKQPHCFVFRAESEAGLRVAKMRYREFSVSAHWFPLPAVRGHVRSSDNVYASSSVSGVERDTEHARRMERAAISHATQHPKATARALMDNNTDANQLNDCTEKGVHKLPQDPNTMEVHLGTGFLRFESEASRISYAASPGLRVVVGTPQLCDTVAAEPITVSAQDVAKLRSSIHGYLEASGRHSDASLAQVQDAHVEWDDYFTCCWVSSPTDITFQDFRTIPWQALMRISNRDSSDMPVVRHTAQGLMEMTVGGLNFRGQEPVGHAQREERDKLHRDLADLSNIRLVDINSGDFVLVLRDPGDPVYTGPGFTAAEHNLPFWLAHVRVACLAKDAAVNPDTLVDVVFWRQLQGNPNGVFIEGRESSTSRAPVRGHWGGKRAKKSNVWSGTIKRSAVLLVNPGFKNKKGISKSLHSATLEAVASLRHPVLNGWIYEKGVGLVFRTPLESFEKGSMFLVPLTLAPPALKTMLNKGAAAYWGTIPSSNVRFPAAVVKALVSCEVLSASAEVQAIGAVSWFYFKDGDPNNALLEFKPSAGKGKKNPIHFTINLSALMIKLSASDVKKKLLSVATKAAVARFLFRILKKWELAGDGRLIRRLDKDANLAASCEEKEVANDSSSTAAENIYENSNDDGKESTTVSDDGDDGSEDEDDSEGAGDEEGDDDDGGAGVEGRGRNARSHGKAVTARGNASKRRNRVIK